VGGGFPGIQVGPVRGAADALADAPGAHRRGRRRRPS
jgi:hypothetical protein